MKQQPQHVAWRGILEYQSLLMLFHNPSLRTHVSFETAATHLGAKAQYRSAEMDWGKLTKQFNENIKDTANVLSRYVNGISIRILLDAVSHYGAGHQILRDYAAVASVPVFSMADDRFHPCQALADLLCWVESSGQIQNLDESLNALRGKKLLLSWGGGNYIRPWSSVQSQLLLASRLGMNICIARPDGYDLDPEVCGWAREHCKAQGSSLEVIDNPESGYANTHIVLVRNWISTEAYQDGQLQKTREVERSLKHSNWIVTAEKMRRTDNAIFTNPMPLARGMEATNEVADGPRSMIYEIAENRLHVQKALLALSMGNALANPVIADRILK